ncbi:hypothetical protein Tco_0030758 [Tanacetum coccineum]
MDGMWSRNDVRTLGIRGYGSGGDDGSKGYVKLNFVEEPVKILEREFKKQKQSRIPIIKVRWNSKRGPEFTWEHEDHMKLKYPHLFSVSDS